MFARFDIKSRNPAATLLESLSRLGLNVLSLFANSLVAVDGQDVGEDFLLIHWI